MGHELPTLGEVAERQLRERYDRDYREACELALAVDLFGAHRRPLTAATSDEATVRFGSVNRWLDRVVRARKDGLMLRYCPELYDQWLQTPSGRHASEVLG